MILKVTKMLEPLIIMCMGTSIAGLMLARGPLAPMPGPTTTEAQTKSKGRAQAPTVPARDIPSCAWKRSLGDLPKIALMPEEGVPPQDRAGLNTLMRVKKGIPLGGIGAGQGGARATQGAAGFRGARIPPPAHTNRA